MVTEANKAVVRRLIDRRRGQGGGPLHLLGHPPREWRSQPPTGRRFERVAEVSVFRFRDGKIVHVWSLEDTLERLRQLGLAPQAG